MKDVYYILFRHKWRILACSLAGFAAAAALFKFFPPPFQSEAKLLVRYVIAEEKSVEVGPEDAITKSPDQRGETIMNAEVEILNSFDLARQVAQKVGAQRVLAKHGGGADVAKATGIIRNGLVVAVPLHSSVIHVTFKDSDAELVQPVLREVVARYLQMHADVHRSIGQSADFLAQQTDQLRASLAQTEDELRKARTKAGVISLEDAKKEFTDQLGRTEQDLYQSQAQLAQQVALVDQLTRAVGHAPTATGPVAAAPEAVQPPTTLQIDEYNGLLDHETQLRRREQELLGQFTAENPRVQEVRNNILEAETRRKKFEAAHPAVVAAAAGTARAPVPGATAPTLDLATEVARVAALKAKVEVLSSQLDHIRKSAAGLDQMESSIVELRRRQQLEEANYKYFARTLEQSRINDALGTTSVSNISQIQTPTPPFKDWSKMLKILAGVAASGIGAGLGWAVLIEFVLDHSVRRPIDVEKTLKLPLFLTIPDFRRRRYRRMHRIGRDTPLCPTRTTPGTKAASTAVTRPFVQPLHAFHEALRDRLVGYFESRDVTWNPKLVAVTGIGGNSGVTTTAAGLAACLSESGDSNVLLVDLTPGQGSAKAFRGGEEICGNLDELLESGDPTRVQEKLYVVGEAVGDNGRALPRRFAKLVPQLKASQFDYIIFDLPPVTQISITPRLAGYMDMVLLVLESEVTDAEIAQRAAKLLTEAKAHVGAVLNKTRSYLPSRLHRVYMGQI